MEVTSLFLLTLIAIIQLSFLLESFAVSHPAMSYLCPWDTIYR